MWTILVKKHQCKSSQFIALIILILLPTKIIAQGDLLIFPKRILFEGNKQNNQELNITNIGTDSATYSISFIQYEMTEDGNMTQINNDIVKPWYANPYLRVFPRKITLAPGESQTLRLQLRRKSDMNTGEYRSHLYFRSEKNNSPLGTEIKKNDGKLSVHIIPVYGITIPTIIRIGSTNATATFSDVKMEPINDSISNLKVTINRYGNSSLYGDLLVEYVPNKGNPVEIASSKGIGVYTCINRRLCNLYVKNIRKYNLNNGKIRVKYKGQKDSTEITYAEKDL